MNIGPCCFCKHQNPKELSCERHVIQSVTQCGDFSIDHRKVLDVARKLEAQALKNMGLIECDACGGEFVHKHPSMMIHEMSAESEILNTYHFCPMCQSDISNTMCFYKAEKK